MESFPSNVRELAKEIAAFATSNQGTILIGVSDSGDLVGVNDADTLERRNQLLARLHGICRGTVKPAITPTAKFAVEDGETVLVILVPKGHQPVYYSHNVPYVRHITESRPAEPHEVVQFIRAWLSTANLEAEADPYADLLSQLASILVDVVIYGEQTEEREVNPWLDLWRAQYQNAAERLRQLAVDDVAIGHGLPDELNALAASLEAVAQFRLYLGCAREFGPLKQRALDTARRVKSRYVDPVPLSESALANAREVIATSARELDSFVPRMANMVEQGRIEDVQSKASEIGYTLLRVSYYNIDALYEGVAERLRVIARGLHLVETMRLYLDGGRSMQAILQRIQEQQEALAQLVTELGQG